MFFLNIGGLIMAEIGDYVVVNESILGVLVIKGEKCPLDTISVLRVDAAKADPWLINRHHLFQKDQYRKATKEDEEKFMIRLFPKN